MDKHIWTVSEVRKRLEDYNLPDDLYYCQAVRFSAMKIGHSSSASDSMPAKMQKLLERGQLFTAVMSLYPVGKISTDEQKERRFLCYLLQMRYISEPKYRISDISNITGKPWQTVKNQINYAIYLVTGYLNGEVLNNNETVTVLHV
jgi:hypothetical protein